MLKYFLTILVLVHVVSSRATFDERQWQEDDKRQHCTEVCTKSCDNCTRATICTDQEIKCPDNDDNVHNDCPRDEICVPIGCQCITKGNYGQECPMLCTVTCEDDEILCPGDTLNSGCKESDFCHPKGTGINGVICEGYCPKECEDSEHKCPVPNDPVTDCVREPVCVPKDKDRWGYICSKQTCPVECEDTELHCSGPKDYRGCKVGDMCVPKGTDSLGELCDGNCPIECDQDEILCNGQENSDGCYKADQCKQKARDKNGLYCPDESASHECPVECQDDEIFCPPKTDPLTGCLEEAICVPKSVDNNGNLCPEGNECPTECPPGHVSCPTGNDENGCKKPNECKEQERNLDGELCTVHCNNVPDCTDDEIFCPGPRNNKGCTEPHQCIPRGIKTKGDDEGGLCPGWCPAKCDRDEILCPSHEDPCDGCPTEEVCRIAAKDANGLFCSGFNYPNEYFSASHGCPRPCDEIDGYVLCPSHEMANGCALESICMPRQKDFYGDYCPSYSTCTQYCNSGEMTCDYGVDIKGCKEPPMCIEIGLDKDGFLCPGICPAKCINDEALQHGGTAGNGCLLPSTCQDIVRMNETFHCYEWSYVDCVDNPNAECDFGGFYTPRQWKPTLQEATDFCLSDESCKGITRSDDGYEPRKGPSISSNPNAYEAWYCINTVYNPYYQKVAE